MKSAPSSALRSAGFVCLLLCGLCLLAAPRASRGDGTPIQDPLTGHWYQEVSVPEGITWPAARQAAEALTYQGQRGYLATLTTDGERRFIAANLPRALTDQAWLGAFQPAGSPEPGGGWQWITGETWRYTRWHSGEPNDATQPTSPTPGEDCLMFWDVGDWNDYPGVLTNKGYVVEYGAPILGDGPVFNPTNGHWYEAVSAPAGIRWPDSRAAAATRTYQGHRGYLATLTSAAENQFVVDNFPEAVDGHWHLGAFQPVGNPEPDGGWEWITGEPWQYTNWNDGEPNNSANDDVLAFLSNGRWNDAISTQLHTGYVVEYGDPLPPVGPSFFAPSLYSVPTPRQVTTADLDGDGFQDVIAESDGNAAVLYGHGDGTFDTVALYPLTAGGAAEWAWVIAVDVNGDGRRDLIGVGKPNQAAVRLNQGNRVFGPATSYPVGVLPRTVISGDFNGDGALDLAVSNYGTPSLGVLLNRGNGTFSPMVSFPAVGKPGVLVTADFNGDGILDIAMTQYDQNSVRTYFGTGNGGFTVGADYPAADHPGSIITGDFDGNGTVDLLVSNGHSNNVCVFFGNGRGFFTRSSFYDAGSFPHLAATADLDGDGDLDLAVPNYGDSQLDLLINDGTGAFRDSFKLAPGGLNTRATAIADFNRDGRPDVAVTNQDSSTVAIFLNDTPGFPAPSAPAGLTVKATTPKTLALTWQDKSRNEGGFEVERKTATGWTRIATPPADSTGYQDSGLAYGTSYTYRVRAVGAGGPSAWSNEATGETLPSPPGKPTLSANQASPTQVALAWQTPDQRATGFEVQRRQGAGDWAFLANTGASPTTLTDSGLTTNLTYSYRVRGTNAGGASEWSDEASVALRPGPPAAPTGLIVSAVYKTRIELDWQSPGDTDGFQIDRRIEDGAWERLGTAGSPHYEDTGLAPGTRYGYRVRGTNAGGVSPWSEAVEATTLGQVPGVPAGVRATALSASRIQVTWQDPDHNATSFQIERRTAGGGWVSLPDATTPAYTDTGLTAKTAYIYHVRGTNASGVSAWSPEVSAFTLGAGPTSPGTLTAIVVQFAKIRLKWQDKSKDETAFFVERKEGTGEFVTLKQLKPNATTYDDLAVTPGVTYTYRIRAEKAGGEPSFSNPASATIPLGGKLSITPRSVAFAITKAGKKRVQVVQLKNSGHEVLVGSVGTLDAPFRIVTGGGAFTLIPGALKNVTVEFAPTVVGRVTGSLSITSSQVDQPTATVRVSGEGRN
jgi:hypothetical protein